MPLKMNNNRRYPNANHQPRHLAKSRKEDALTRQEAYDKLTLAEKLQQLDTVLGAGVGAVKQRTRLHLLMEKKNQPKREVDTSIVSLDTLPKELQVVGGETTSKQEKQYRKYMKGSK